MSFIKDIYHKMPHGRILMLHHVTNETENLLSSCVISVENFRKILIKYKDRIVSLDTFLNSGKLGFIKKDVLTFDDGLKDFKTNAFPLLKELNIPFTIFVSADMLDKDGYLSSDDVKKISESPLATIGSHGVSHCILTQVDVETKKNEIISSADTLEKLINKKIKYFAYSHGQYDNDCLKILDNSKYEYALSTQGKQYDLRTNRLRWAQPRINAMNETIDRIMEE